MSTLPRTVVLPICIIALLLGVGCDEGSSDNSASAPVATAATTAAATAPATGAQPNSVVKEILATQVDPPGAPGRTLTLVRYTIVPGAELPVHVHPGVQLASIQSGTLTYTIVSGTAEVKRASGQTESVTGPSTITVGPNGAVAETADLVHFGANKTDAPVVIVATLLTENGRDPAVTIPPTAPPSG